MAGWSDGGTTFLIKRYKDNPHWKKGPLAPKQLQFENGMQVTLKWMNSNSNMIVIFSDI